MTKQDKRKWQRLQELRREGWDLSKDDVNAVRFHSGSETIQHIAVKTFLAHALVEAGSTVATEVDHPDRGAVDLLDLNPSGVRAVAYEVETGSSSDPTQRRLKEEQYLGGVVGECIVVDPLDAPTELGALREWCERRCL